MSAKLQSPLTSPIIHACPPPLAPLLHPPPAPLQSITLAGAASSGGRGAQPLGELAMAKDEVKARLAPIPVYTVANPKNEFVLVAGEVRRCV